MFSYTWGRHFGESVYITYNGCARLFDRCRDCQAANNGKYARRYLCSLSCFTSWISSFINSVEFLILWVTKIQKEFLK